MAKKIQEHFPPHRIYIEPFFGAGGMFFNKPKAEYNFLNDLDSDVFNLFNIVSTQKDELVTLFELMPIHQDLFYHWVANKETEPIKKALRFLMLSNFSLYGKMDTLAIGCSNTKEMFFKNLNKTVDYIKNAQFTNRDYRKMFASISLNENERKDAFIYCDPPYLETTDNYSNSFKEDDASDLFDCLVDTGVKFAYSEFDHPFILKQAESRNLNVEYIGERKNLGNRRTEILVTNYKHKLSLF